MNSKFKSTVLVATFAALGAFVAVPALAVDDDAAKLLFKQNECTKCHAPDKAKKGPALKKIAKDYKGKADAEAKLLDRFTKGGKVKLEDGSEEDHKIVDTKDQAALKNLAQWILAQ